MQHRLIDAFLEPPAVLQQSLLTAAVIRSSGMCQQMIHHNGDATKGNAGRVHRKFSRPALLIDLVRLACINES